MQSITSADYAVHFGSLAYDALSGHLATTDYSKIFILVDENTHLHCLSPFLDKLSTTHTIVPIQMVSGEEHKTITTCVDAWNALSDLGADRKALLINLGGGVVTDLGGFVASTFKRGITFINVPTTLLAMVDASVGGKTGVDLGSLKNQIGVINQPEMVLVVPEFLITLDTRQLWSGFAEMLKHGLIQDADYWEALKLISAFDGLDSLIYDSVCIKNAVVRQDPTEQHVRKILNFGHTLGHAIESYFLAAVDRPTLLHGEAIVVGMILESFLSSRLTGLPEDQLSDISKTLIKRYGKVDITTTDIPHILELLQFDKKNYHGRINFVLLEAIGTPNIDVQVPGDLFEAAFSYYREQ